MGELITASATVVAAVLTGFCAAALKNRWDREAKAREWENQAADRRRVELLLVYKQELAELMLLEQKLWHPVNRRVSIDSLEPERADSIRDSMRSHAMAYVGIELLGGARVVARMSEVNKAVVKSFFEPTRPALRSLRDLRNALTADMREDLNLPPSSSLLNAELLASAVEADSTAVPRRGAGA